MKKDKFESSIEPSLHEAFDVLETSYFVTSSGDGIVFLFIRERDSIASIVNTICNDTVLPIEAVRRINIDSKRPYNEICTCVCINLSNI
jgi:hypothetical protein